MAFPREKCTSVFQGGTATSLSLALSLSLLLLHATKNYIYIYIYFLFLALSVSPLHPTCDSFHGGKSHQCGRTDPPGPSIIRRGSSFVRKAGFLSAFHSPLRSSFLFLSFFLFFWFLTSFFLLFTWSSSSFRFLRPSCSSASRGFFWLGRGKAVWKLCRSLF